MKNYTIIALSIIIFLGLSIVTVVTLFSIASEKEMAIKNEQLAALKTERKIGSIELDDPEVRKILDQETTYYREHLSYAGILIIIYFVILVAFLGRFSKNAAAKHQP